MFHSDVRKNFDLNTWIEELKIVSPISMFLMHSHGKPGKRTAQLRTALSDSLIEMLV